MDIQATDGGPDAGKRVGETPKASDLGVLHAALSRMRAADEERPAGLYLPAAEGDGAWPLRIRGDRTAPWDEAKAALDSLADMLEV